MQTSSGWPDHDAGQREQHQRAREREGQVDETTDPAVHPAAGEPGDDAEDDPEDHGQHGGTHRDAQREARAEQKAGEHVSAVAGVDAEPVIGRRRRRSSRAGASPGRRSGAAAPGCWPPGRAPRASPGTETRSRSACRATTTLSETMDSLSLRYRVIASWNGERPAIFFSASGSSAFWVGSMLWLSNPAAEMLMLTPSNRDSVWPDRGHHRTPSIPRRRSVTLCDREHSEGQGAVTIWSRQPVRAAGLREFSRSARLPSPAARRSPLPFAAPG